MVYSNLIRLSCYLHLSCSPFPLVIVYRLLESLLGYCFSPFSEFPCSLTYNLRPFPPMILVFCSLRLTSFTPSIFVHSSSAFIFLVSLVSFLHFFFFFLYILCNLFHVLPFLENSLFFFSCSSNFYSSIGFTFLFHMLIPLLGFK